MTQPARDQDFAAQRFDIAAVVLMGLLENLDGERNAEFRIENTIDVGRAAGADGPPVDKAVPGGAWLLQRGRIVQDGSLGHGLRRAASAARALRSRCLRLAPEPLTLCGTDAPRRQGRRRKDRAFQKKNQRTGQVRWF